MQSLEYINYIAPKLSDKYSTDGISSSCGYSGVNGPIGISGPSGTSGPIGNSGSSGYKGSMWIKDYCNTYTYSGKTCIEKELSVLEIYEILPFGYNDTIKLNKTKFYIGNQYMHSLYE